MKNKSTLKNLIWWIAIAGIPISGVIFQHTKNNIFLVLFLCFGVIDIYLAIEKIIFVIQNAKNKK